MIKALDELGVDWLHTIRNEFLTDEQIPGDLKESEIVTIYKQKGDALECGNYRGIKLLEIALRVYERVIERRIRERVHDYISTPVSLDSCQEEEPLIQFLFSAKCRKRSWKGIENNTGHFWTWRKLLTECRERCYTGVEDERELVRSL